MIIRRRRRRRQRREDMSDYASTISSHRPSRFNFNWPSLPFNRQGPDGSQPTRQFTMPFGGGANKRSNSSIMDEAMRAAYGSDAASVHSVQGYLDEKKHDPNYQLPILEPAPVMQAGIRKSIASWFRRSPGNNHPLKLNPMSRWSRSTTRSAAGGGADEGSQYAPSIYSAPGQGAAIPPMPDLALQRAYTAGTTTPMGIGGVRMSTSTGTPSNPAELASVYTLDDDEDIAALAAPAAAAMQPSSHWSASSIGSAAGAVPGVPAQQRIQSIGSWSSGTRTTMSPDERESMATGLSPPSYYLGGSNASLATATGGLTPREGAPGAVPHGGERLTNLHQELLVLYAQGESAAAGEQGKSGTAASGL